MNKNNKIVICLFYFIITFFICIMIIIMGYSENKYCLEINSLNSDIEILKEEKESWIKSWEDEKTRNIELENKLYNKISTLFDFKNNMFSYLYIDDYYFYTNENTYKVNFPGLKEGDIIYIEDFGYYEVSNSFIKDNIIDEPNDKTNIDYVHSVWLCIPNIR